MFFFLEIIFYYITIFEDYLESDMEKILKTMASAESLFQKNNIDFKELFFSIVEKNHNAVLIHNNQQILFANSKVLEITEYSLEELYNQSVWNFVSQEDVEMVKSNGIKRINGEKVPELYEFKIKAKSGKLKNVQMAFKTIEISGQTLILTIFKDITKEKQDEKLILQMLEKEKKAKEEAEKANKSKTHFFLSLIHDVRVAVNAISGLIDSFDTTNFSAQNKKVLNQIKSAGDSLIYLVSDTLDLAEIEQNRITLKKSKFNIKTTITEIVDFFKFSAEKKSVALKSYISEETPTFVCGDLLKFKRIILNLLNNAIKFTKEGFVLLNIDLKEKKDNYFFINIKLRDSGTGISKEKQKEIFNIFSKDSSNSKNNGNGIGLFVVSNFIKAMNGTIKLESSKESGTSFSITIPFEVPEKSEATTQKTKESNETNKLSNIHCLLIDDNPMNLKVESMILKKMNFSSQTVSSGKEAVEILKNNPKKFDVVLTDLQMPEMDGFQTLEAIKKIDPKIPVIAVTAFAMESDKKKCEEAGMDGYVSKPVQKQTLYDEIAKTLKKEQSHESQTKQTTKQIKETSLNYNIKNFKKRTGLDEEILKTFLLAFEKQKDEELDEIYNAILSKNREAIKKTAHKFKGQLANLEMVKASKLSEKIEKSAFEKEFEELMNFYKTLKNEVYETVEYINKNILKNDKN